MKCKNSVCENEGCADLNGYCIRCDKIIAEVETVFTKLQVI